MVQSRKSPWEHQENLSRTNTIKQIKNILVCYLMGRCYCLDMMVYKYELKLTVRFL